MFYSFDAMSFFCRFESYYFEVKNLAKIYSKLLLIKPKIRHQHFHKRITQKTWTMQ